MCLRTITAAIAIATLSIVGTACTDAGSPILIMQNQVPGADCVVPSGLGGEYNPRGRIDTNASAGYLLTPLVQNVANTEGVEEHLRMAFIEGADIDLSVQEGGPAVTASLSFSKRFSGTIQPNGGLSSFAFTVIPLEVLADLAEGLTEPTQLVEVMVDVKIYGNIAGGDVSTPVFSYAVDVCNGCMKNNVGACADLSDSFVAMEGGVCVDLQDSTLDCCTTADSQELCPAESPATE
jgi:hypothetical protein